MVFYAKPRNADSQVAQMRKMLLSPGDGQEAMGRVGHRKVIDGYFDNVVIDTYFGVINDALENAGPESKYFQYWQQLPFGWAYISFSYEAKNQNELSSMAKQLYLFDLILEH